MQVRLTYLGKHAPLHALGSEDSPGTPPTPLPKNLYAALDVQVLLT